jgi:hypothetical protein
MHSFATLVPGYEIGVYDEESNNDFVVNIHST